MVAWETTDAVLAVVPQINGSTVIAMIYYRTSRHIPQRPEINGSFAVEISNAKKITGCSATYVSPTTCPQDCIFLNNGCMAETGNLRLHTRKIQNHDPDEAIDNETEHIQWLSGLRPLRLHEVGDCTTNRQASVLAHAVTTFSTKHGHQAWTYTHGWRTVNRTSWGTISVLASCEKMEYAQQAREEGYATALVVPNQLETAPHATKLQTGEILVPCPAETTKTTCFKCALCLNDRWLLAQRIVIIFSAHGSGKTKIQQALRRLS